MAQLYPVHPDYCESSGGVQHEEILSSRDTLQSVERLSKRLEFTDGTSSIVSEPSVVSLVMTTTYRRMTQLTHETVFF